MLTTDAMGTIVPYVVSGMSPEDWLVDYANTFDDVTIGEVRALFAEIRADMAAYPDMEWDTPGEQPTPDNDRKTS